ncbi:HAMP domain-containing sensor histidine kinase [Clostridium sp. JS66]|uniref:sensor histidine kinase n=1 Tax=Clostridium sp. JS66 TaxID=3064705 RepID=UPI00298D7A6C|nr:HAMP domain-containing sensor histidine kinase [Clostridium sp. JS66]WPC40535.1 HAMP domain-containing sensor histidine kinase [Clostridium sp. JS66]
MFKKLKLKLTLINAVVFFILFLMFNIVIYFYTKSSLYAEVDRSLAISRRIIEMNLKNSNPNLSMLDPRVISIVRDNKGNILSDTHMPIFYKSNEEYIKPVKIDELYDVKFKKFNFRTIAFSDQLNGKTVMVQLLRNTNSEKEFMDNVLKIIILGGGIIFLVSISAGWFLAQRTMVPIVTAWEKQRQFVEDASHEMRTPLTVIQSQVQLVFQKPNSKVIENASYLGIALSETRRLSKLVSDLLTLARSDSNAVEIEKRPVDITELIKKVSEPYIEIAEIEHKYMRIEEMKGLTINCDEKRIHQLLVILLDNALKYTYEQGNIEISVKRKDNKCSIVVKDDGAGIREEEKELIFERFYRGDKSRARETGGTGLGLSIAKWIVLKHGGTIRAEKNVPKGTIIEIVLPVN